MLVHWHQCERSILVVSIQKLEHGTRLRTLSLKVTCLHKISSVPCFLPMFPYNLKLRQWDGQQNDCYYRCIQRENGSRHLVWTTFHLVPGHRVLAQAPVWTGHYDNNVWVMSNSQGPRRFRKPAYLMQIKIPLHSCREHLHLEHTSFFMPINKNVYAQK